MVARGQIPATGCRGGQNFRATYWTDETGFINLKNQLDELSADIPDNFTLAAAMSMSDDGRVICGWGYRDGLFFFEESWIAVLPADESPCPANLTGNGLLDGVDLGLLLAAFGTNDPNADRNGYGLVEGADLGLKRAAWGPCDQ